MFLGFSSMASQSKKAIKENPKYTKFTTRYCSPRKFNIMLPKTFQPWLISIHKIKTRL
jgi:hypothetical protein